MLDEISQAALTQELDQTVPPNHLAQVLEVAAAKAQSESADMEFPTWIWIAMFAGYGIFFACMVAATGRDLGALFAIAISAGYTLVYFATAHVLVALKPGARKSLFARGLAPLKTYTGPMSTIAVVGQVLVLPLCLALFGIAILIIRTAIL